MKTPQPVLPYLPDSVGKELGLPQCSVIDGVEQMLPYTINLSKLQALKSMKSLKELLIGDNSDLNEYQSILQSEIPHLKKHEGSKSFKVAMTNTNDFRGIEFCPNCLQYEQPTYEHKCAKN